METTKRELDLMVELTLDLLADIASDCSAYSTHIKDGLQVRRRVASEGVAFLTKTLPTLGKAFDIALSKDDAKMIYVGFKTRRGYPVFLGDLFKLVFTPEGESLRDAGPTIVGHIRQVLYLWYKYELPYTPEQEAELESRFEATDAELPDAVPSGCPVIQGAAKLIAATVAEFDRNAVVPRHGPGAVATREEPWEKFRFKRLYTPIERIFPFSEWYVPSISYLARQPDPLKHLEVLEHGTARAVFVPKDSRGPRLISCEPLEYQWIQQGIAAELIYCINKSVITSGRVNFTHQSVNRRFALLGSMGAGWVTLDMADASDRVSTKLVEALFSECPHVLECLLCARTQCTVLPSGRRVSMKKFAPMGSALCFPVESLVFFALAVNVLVHHLGYNQKVALERVKVYGDDIVVSKEDYLAIMQYFPFVGLKFNDKKCCTGGSFRESCGMDAFKGGDVTPVKIRTRLPSRTDSQALVSAVEYSNAFDFNGYSRMADRLSEYVKNALPRDGWFIPTLGHREEPVAYLAFRRLFTSVGMIAQKERLYRWNKKYQRREFLGICVGGLSISRAMPGWERLFANLADNLPRLASVYRNIPVGDFLKREHQTVLLNGNVAEPEGLKTVRFPLRRRVTLKRRWCALRGVAA